MKALNFFDWVRQFIHPLEKLSDIVPIEMFQIMQYDSYEKEGYQTITGSSNSFKKYNVYPR